MTRAKYLIFIGAVITGCGQQPTVDPSATPVDSTPPATPVVTVPSTLSYTVSGNSNTFTISGACDANTVKITGPNGAAITPTNKTWSYTVTLTSGEMDLGFYAVSASGTKSLQGVTVALTWNPGINFSPSAVIAGGRFKDTATSYSFEANLGSQKTTSYDLHSSFTFDAGFNNMVNSARQ